MEKVLIIANNSNGLYLFRRQLISALIAKGVKVVAVVPFDENLSELQSLGIDLIESPIERRGTNPAKDIKLVSFYKKVIKKQKPDMVLTYTIKPNVYGGAVCRMLSTPYCANITGLGTAFEKEGWLRSLAILLNKVALKKAKVVFFENSENQRFFIENKIIRSSQAHLLHGAGVDLEHFSERAYPSNCDVTRFLFIGRIMKEKGIDELLEAVRKLQEDGNRCTLDVLGLMEEDYSERLRKCSEEGWLSYYGQQEDVRPFIENCHCFVLPSYHEGMANTNLESAASGRPIITSDIPGCKEAVVDEVSGFLCKPKSTKSLERAMRSFLQLSSDQREAMGKAGRKHMEKVFDKRQVVSETIETMMNTTEKKGR